MKKPLELIILGGGTAGWMAANLFAKRWSNEQVKVTLVESPDVGKIGVGEGSTPSLKRFFEILDIPESKWMPRCEATYKTNIRFVNWSPNSGVTEYSHPFPSQVDTFTKRAFLVNTRTRRLGLDTHVNPESFLLNGTLANQGKAPITPENFPFKMEYGYHFNSGLLGEFLAEVAKEQGVKYQQAHIANVERAENGDISLLRTDNGDAIQGDFFIDCSGFASVLMQKTLGVEFQSFKSNLFNDSAVVMPTDMTSSIPVETRSTAMSAGWCWQIPLTSRFGNGYVYSSDHISTDQAEHEFRAFLGQLDNPENCRHLKMKVGQLKQHWAHNCLGLGLSQGFIEPLEATALHLVQVAIEYFIQQFEQGDFSAKHRGNYNDFMSERFERVRDYIVAHYKMNTRNDTDYWRANRDNPNISKSLSQLLSVWFDREDLSAEIARQKIDSHFDDVSWHCLLAGYGAFPPLAQNQPNQGDLYKEQNVADFVNGCSLNFNEHRSVLSKLIQN